MLDVSSKSHSRKKPRSVQSIADGQVIHVSEHVSSTRKSARFTACAAPFLACKNNIMQGEDGIPRCNSPFLHCTRYVFAGDSLEHTPDRDRRSAA